MKAEIMSRQTSLSLALAVLALLAVHWGGVAAASDLGQATDQPGERPLVGMADQTAPYDQRFIDEMVMHHQGAIMSSRMMIGDSQRPELRDLARRIQEGQQRQIDQMQAWRQQWYPSAHAPSMGMDSMAGMMDGRHMGGMMGGRGMMGGQAADRMFLRMMIPHHQLAIDMAQDALQNAEHEELKDLAREIIADQAAEITEMEGYLRAWYGQGPTRDGAGSTGGMMRGMMGGMCMGR